MFLSFQVVVATRKCQVDKFCCVEPKNSILFQDMQQNGKENNCKNAWNVEETIKNLNLIENINVFYKNKLWNKAASN